MSEEYAWGSMHWQPADQSLNQQIALMRILPKNTSDLHLHDNCNETIIAISHGLEVFENNAWKSLEQYKAVVVEKSAPHKIRNAGSEAGTLVIVYDTFNRNYSKL